MNETYEYHIKRVSTDNGVFLGFNFEEHWKDFFLKLNSKLAFIDDLDYNFKYSEVGKIGISLESNYIHIWFEENKFSKDFSEEIILSFKAVLAQRFGKIEYELV